MPRFGLRSFCSSALLACVLFAPESRAQESNYVFESPPNRLALVVANSDYQTQEKLPGTLADKNAIAAVLTGAGFRVVETDNVSRAEFINVHLLPFLGGVK